MHECEHIHMNKIGMRTCMPALWWQRPLRGREWWRQERHSKSCSTQVPESRFGPPVFIGPSLGSWSTFSTPFVQLFGTFRAPAAAAWIDEGNFRERAAMVGLSKDAAIPVTAAPARICRGRSRLRRSPHPERR